MTTGRRERQREQMRARLLDAALTLFEADGYEATTIDRIAEAADVARQTVLNHFPRKLDFVEVWAQDRRDRLRTLDTGDPAEPVRDRLHRCYAALAAANTRERTLTRMLYSPQRALLLEYPVPDAVLAILRTAADRGELRPSPDTGPHADPRADPRAAAEVLTAVYFDALGRWLAPEHPPFDLAAILAARIELVLTGLLPR